MDIKDDDDYEESQPFINSFIILVDYTIIIDVLLIKEIDLNVVIGFLINILLYKKIVISCG